ncbi:MAG: orotate phosphoribosyltransferase [Candidatus Omnitrophica bacterium]|nr:orotate phosphoribosyltransferase [Candidatus Omnitrophota bacterium]
MNEAAILKIFQDSGALLTGHFKLSSGLHSGQYLQCALVLQNPKYAEDLSDALALRFKKERINIVIGPALGGIIVSYEVARALGARALFTERVDGKMVLRRGFNIDKNDRVLVVEDVVTTGLSTKEVIDTVKEFGADLVGVGAIISRAKESPFKERFEALIKIDIPTFEPADCPLCREKIPISKPGSRK